MDSSLRTHLDDCLSNWDITLESVYLFGSKAEGTATEESDTDLLVVSEEFNGIEIPLRSEGFRENWSYEEYGMLDILCYTPSEFEERREKGVSPIREAVEEGVELTS